MKAGSFFAEAPEGRKQDTLWVGGCALCPLDGEELQNPKMPPDGSAKAEFYILGEAPGETEDRKGKPFVGRSGELLRSRIPKGQKVRIWNTIRCRPPDNRNPSSTETECCRKFIEDDILKVRPKAVLLTGAVAFTWLTGMTNYSKWIGRWIPVKLRDFEFWAMPVPHPAYVLRKGERSMESKQLDWGVEDFFAGPPEGYSIPSLEEIDKTISRFESDDDIREFVRAMADSEDPVGLDIETASEETKDRVFRPYGRGARILCVALSCDGRTKVAVGEQVDVMVKAMLSCEKSILLVAHNLAFDLEWMLYFYPELQKAKRIFWHCTLAQSYILHERPPHSLDDLANGVLGLRDLKESSGINVANLANADEDLLVRYCGRDAAICQELFMVQDEMIEDEGLTDVFQEQCRRILPAVQAQIVGLMVDHEAVSELRKELTETVSEVDDDLLKNEDVDQYVAGGHRFDASSPKSVGNFLGCLGFSEQMKSEDRKLGKSTDDATLSKIDHPVVPLILDRRRLMKLLSTYIQPISKDEGGYVWPDGKLHPQYSMSKLVSRRSSCTNPNIQNQPKRDPEASKAVRDCFIAPKDFVFLSFDYGQIEARVVAMASGDDFLVKAMEDGYDIHSEWGRRIVEAWPEYSEHGRDALEDEGKFKAVRQKAKAWVFGNLFGSTLKGAMDHVEAPEEVVQDLYDQFWVQLPGVKKWHKKLIREYDRNGYVETLTGFRRHGPMRYNEIINTPIQSAAFDIVCKAWSMFYYAAYRGEPSDRNFFPVIQVHDDLTFVVPEKEVDWYSKWVSAIALDTTAFPFINIPLTGEVSVGPRWGSLEFHKAYDSRDFAELGKVC